MCSRSWLSVQSQGTTIRGLQSEVDKQGHAAAQLTSELRAAKDTIASLGADKGRWACLHPSAVLSTLAASASHVAPCLRLHVVRACGKELATSALTPVMACVLPPR